MTKFLAVGNALVDIVARVPSPTTIEIDSKTVEKILCVNFASKTELDGCQVQFGGSAANTAIALSCLGERCEIATAVGNDAFGKMVLDDLKRHGVGTRSAVSLKRQTGMSIILLAQGEKSVLTYHGAFARLSPQHLGEEAVRQADAVIFTSLSSKENYALFLKAVKICEKLRKKIVFAPSITMLRAREKEFRKLHGKFDLVIMNREEAAQYTGKTDPIKALHGLPGRTRVITDGPGGAYALSNGEIFRIGSAAGKVVDTTGAGDAFTGAFCHEFYSSGDVREALRTATAVSALKLATLGAHLRNKASEVRNFKKTNASKLVVKKIA